MNALRDTLLHAAREEFAAKGYKKGSMAAIARAAGVAVGSIYTVFPSKQALFLDVYFWEAHTVQQQVIEHIDWDQPRSALCAFLSETTAHNASNPILAAWQDEDIGPAVQAACQEQGRSSQLHSFLISQLAVWRSTGKTPAGLRDELLLDVLDAMCRLDQHPQLDETIKQIIVAGAIDKVFETRSDSAGSRLGRMFRNSKQAMQPLQHRTTPNTATSTASPAKGRA